MGLNATDKLVARSRVTADEAIDGLIAAVQTIDAKDREFAVALADACTEVNVDFALAFSHCANETNFFRSRFWNEHLNPAGIGITGEPGVTGPTFPSATKAARFYIALILLKLRGSGDIGAFEAERETAPSFFDGTRTFARDPTFPHVVTLDDPRRRFGPNNRECVWMCDEEGAIAIAQKAAILFPGLPDQEEVIPMPPTQLLNMTRGLIPLPHIEDHIVDVTQRCPDDWDRDRRIGRGYDFLGARQIDALFVHRSQGTWDTNIGSFDSNCPAALTDLQVDNTDGRMMRFVRLNAPPATTGSETLSNGQVIDIPSGWASGPADNPVGNAARLIAVHGGSEDAVNRFAESIEVTGFFNKHDGTDDPISEAARQNIAQWMASRAHDRGIPWHEFPTVPNEGRSFICGHRESRGGNVGDCPGNFLWSLISTRDADLIKRARAIMKEAQIKGVYPEARVPISGVGRMEFEHAPAITVRAQDPSRFVCIRGTRLRTYPHRDAPAGVKTPARRRRNYTFPFACVVDGETWLASTKGSWALATAFEPLS